jgi:hypothetical protein
MYDLVCRNKDMHYLISFYFVSFDLHFSYYIILLYYISFLRSEFLISFLQLVSFLSLPFPDFFTAPLYSFLTYFHLHIPHITSLLSFSYISYNFISISIPNITSFSFPYLFYSTRDRTYSTVTTSTSSPPIPWP